MLGLPLLYIGVALMAIHFVCKFHSNALLIIALILEIAGTGFHYYKIKHNH